MTARPMTNGTPPQPHATGASRVRRLFWTPGRTALAIAGTSEFGMSLVSLAGHLDPDDSPLIGAVVPAVQACVWLVAAMLAVIAAGSTSPRWRGRCTRTAWGALTLMPGFCGIDAGAALVESVVPGPPDPSAALAVGRLVVWATVVVALLYCGRVTEGGNDAANRRRAETQGGRA